MVRAAVEVLGHRSDTFQVNARHYAIVAISGLVPASCVEYEAGDSTDPTLQTTLQRQLA